MADTESWQEDSSVVLSVVALGKTVVYNPERLLCDLVARNRCGQGPTADRIRAETTRVRELVAAERDQLIERAVVEAYRALGLALADGQLGGIIQLVYAGVHVPNVVLVAAGYLK